MSLGIQEPTPASIWAIMQETARQQRETDRQIQKTDRQIQETDRQIQEIVHRQKKTDQQMQKTDQGIQQLSREIKEAKDLFTTQWGRLIEALVDGRLIELFNQWGISVYDTSPRVRGNRDGRSYEFDIIAHNGDKIVIVEVKTTLRPDDVKKFLRKLRDAKTLMPRYKDNTIYGAMAWLHANAGADAMAINEELFSIRAVGDSARITNKPGFQPKAF